MYEYVYVYGKKRMSEVEDSLGRAEKRGTATTQLAAMNGSRPRRADGRWSSAAARVVAVLAVLSAPAPRAASACVGTECFEIWSTNAPAGARTPTAIFEHRT